jgi:alanine racemase
MLTWAEIDLSAISHNIRQIKSIVEPEGSSILAVIKDNAYGHGAVEVARVAESENVRMFGVATVEEAMQLRQASIKTPILIFCCILPEQAKEVIQYDITQTVCDLRTCKSLSESAKRLGKKAKVHVKVDTGMGRIGIAFDKAVELIKQIVQLPYLVIEGVYTHFASADTDEAFTTLQIERFNSTLSALNDIGIHIPIRHAAGSAGILFFRNSAERDLFFRNSAERDLFFRNSAERDLFFRNSAERDLFFRNSAERDLFFRNSAERELNFPSSYYDMVRPGLILYGLYPCANPYHKVELKPALSLKTRVVYLKELPAGHSVSYERTYITDRPTIVATLAVGYGHGYSRKLSNKGEVLIRGKRAQIIGLICMDQCLCDVTNIPDVSVGDEVVLIGSQGDEEITADEIAEKVGTISYEILCGVNANVRRIYKS